jgi:hypothetical protein
MIKVLIIAIVLFFICYFIFFNSVFINSIITDNLSFNSNIIEHENLKIHIPEYLLKIILRYLLYATLVLCSSSIYKFFYMIFKNNKNKDRAKHINYFNF